MSSSPAGRPAGTAESRWTDWPGLTEARRLPLPTGQVVVISAHPDDEVIGAGGLLADLDDDSPAPRFVLVTDGEGSHAHTPDVDPVELARARVVELVEALQLLGHQAPPLHRLRLPDARVADHVDELHYRIERSIRGADLVICPAANDGHIDHETVGRTTLAACAGQVEVWQMPIWLWHWTGPEDPGVDWRRLGRLDLTESAQLRKRQALHRFRSQVAPVVGDPTAVTILPPEVLAHFTRPFEAFFA